MLEFAQLPVGDYIISKRMCVERKTVQDFESSIMNSRVFDQLDRLSHEFGKPILILEGDEADFTMQRNAILGAIISIYRDYNVQVMRSEGTWDTVTMLARLAEKEQEDRSREPKIVGSKRAYTDSQWQVLILGALPGIGPKLAVSLIRHFKTIRGVASAEPKDLMEVEKVGKKKAERIHSLLNSEFTEEQSL
jgi:Fanconi anemia group M protein